MTKRAAVILAAGQGTRMKSERPKVLHEIGGRAMLDWSIALARQVGCERILVVCSVSGAAVQAHVRERLGSQSVIIQDPPSGTGHAVRCAESALAGFDGDVVVLYGDTPLIPAEAIEGLFAEIVGGASIGVLGFETADPGAYGRLITGQDGDLEAIIEASEASPAQLSVKFCNSGVLAAPASFLFSLLARIRNDNAKGEYYLTDIVALAREAQARCAAVRCSETDVLGVNSRFELAAAEAAFQARIRRHFLLQGVTMTAPDTVFFSHDTEIEADVHLEPHIVFGPGVKIARGSRVRAFSHLEGASLASECEVGPYARLRPGSVLEQKAKIGNFVEVKKAHIGQGAKANHLAYLGDAEIGSEANIGAGTIFCNYDGFFKHKTIIGQSAFIGSNS